MAIRTLRTLGLALLAFVLVTAGTVACSSGEDEGSEVAGSTLEEGQVEFEGTVKIVVGQYVFVPGLRGFDIVVQSSLLSGELADLLEKEVKGLGHYTTERPTILILETLEVKDEAGNLTPIYTAPEGEDAPLDDFLSVQARDEFVFLEKLSYNKAEDWEGKEKVKVYGKMEGEEGSYKIVVFDERGREAGKINVATMTDFALYYSKKLRLFDDFYFYLTVKDTVDWASRRRTRELFNADVHLAGLF
ncbi:hypothetical protein ACFLT9_09365 [Acidobacteriota bacterium]